MNQRFGRFKFVEEWTHPKTGLTEESFDNPERTFFLFHGYGADCEDLRSLAQVMNTGHETHWIFPNGPLSVPIGPGWSGSAWWPIDLSRFEKPDDLSWTAAEPKELPKLREEILAWIARVEPDWNKVILGGFSQGAMLATDLFLHAPQTPRGLVLLSGALINSAAWTAQAKVRAADPARPPRFFQSHGQKDQVLPFKVASQLETMLIQAGFKGSLMSFSGTHEIPMNVVEKVNQFLKSL
jgi:phospholipase/carboxylesterase